MGREGLFLAAALAALITIPAPSLAHGLFSHGKPAATPASPKAAAIAAQVSQALDEKRYADAATLLDQAAALALKSPQLTTLSGELHLARGRYADALAAFRAAAVDPAQKPRALQGSGIALSLLGRSDEALADLKVAAELDKTQWRAWNGLGREYDLRSDWLKAKAAYAAALAAPGANTAVVLNNRGYSELLQNNTAAAAADFVSALEKDPSLAPARTNLRITLAMQGQYARATMTGIGDDRAAVLNNVGLAAALHGDYPQADKLLGEAMAAKGQFYGRAAENLQLSHELATRRDQTLTATDAHH